VAGLLTVIPGLDTALVLRAAITQGRRQGFATALGINTGALVWGAGAAVGVSALLTASSIAYMLVRIAAAQPAFAPPRITCPKPWPLLGLAACSAALQRSGLGCDSVPDG